MQPKVGWKNGSFRRSSATRLSSRSVVEPISVVFDLVEAWSDVGGRGMRSRQVERATVLVGTSVADNYRRRARRRTSAPALQVSRLVISAEDDRPKDDRGTWRGVENEERATSWSREQRCRKVTVEGRGEKRKREKLRG